jgi:hypothetical protein
MHGSRAISYRYGPILECGRTKALFSAKTGCKQDGGLEFELIIFSIVAENNQLKTQASARISEH